MGHSPEQIVRQMAIRRAKAHKTSDAPDISGAHISSCKKKKTLDPQVFSRIGKTIKKIQRIPNTLKEIVKDIVSARTHHTMNY